MKKHRFQRQKRNLLVIVEKSPKKKNRRNDFRQLAVEHKNRKNCGKEEQATAEKLKAAISGELFPIKQVYPTVHGL